MVKKITVKVIRDQARAVQENFFPFMELLCKTRIKETEDAGQFNENMNEIIVDSLLAEIKSEFETRLGFQANGFIIGFSQPQAIAFLKLLSQLPPNTAFPYLNDLRSFFITELENQVFEIG